MCLNSQQMIAVIEQALFGGPDPYKLMALYTPAEVMGMAKKFYDHFFRVKDKLTQAEATELVKNLAHRASLDGYRSKDMFQAALKNHCDKYGLYHDEPPKPFEPVQQIDFSKLKPGPCNDPHSPEEMAERAAQVVADKEAQQARLVAIGAVKERARA